MMTNEARADRAQSALDAYIAFTADSPDESHFRDLLTDLMHLAARDGAGDFGCPRERDMTFAEALDMAERNFTHDVDDDLQDSPSGDLDGDVAAFVADGDLAQAADRIASEPTYRRSNLRVAPYAFRADGILLPGPIPAVAVEEGAEDAEGYAIFRVDTGDMVDSFDSEEEAQSYLEAITVGDMLKGSCIAIVGSPVDGFSYTGPFADFGAAEAFVEHVRHDTYWIASLVSPAG